MSDYEIGSATPDRPGPGRPDPATGERMCECGEPRAAHAGSLGCGEIADIRARQHFARMSWGHRLATTLRRQRPPGWRGSHIR